MSATKDDKSRLRVGVAVGVVLVFLAVALTFFYDTVMRRRSRADVRRDEDADDEGDLSGIWREYPEPQKAQPLAAQGQGSSYALLAGSGRGSRRLARGRNASAPERETPPTHLAQDR